MSLTYETAIAYLNSFIDHSKNHAANLAPENFDLARVHTLMESLGNPHHTYPVIHIAGTKGKGSTAAFCATALQTAGCRTGLYTSPHLEDYVERFQIDRTPISHKDFASLVKDIQPHVAQIPAITSFEIEAALAFWYFARENVKAAVIEVGMGGRLDATNVVTPLVSVITSISLDHVPILGTTIAEIAGEKAGIIKEECPIISSPQEDSAKEVIHRIANERHASVVQIGEQVTFKPVSHSLSGQRFQLTYFDEPSVEIEISLLGPHQIENATTAYTALRVAQEGGLEIAEAAIHEGLAKTVWPGRFEIIRSESVPIILDSAHNQHSMRRLRETLNQYFPDQDVVLVFGVSGDKNVREMLVELKGNGILDSGRILTLIATQSNHTRALASQQLADLAMENGYTTEVVSVVGKALSRAQAIVPPNGVILVTGSIFIVGEARKLFH